jgi:hypothetical protein
MKIYLRRAAHISVERLISVQTDEQTEIDMETNMDVDIGDKFVYIRAFWPREDSQSTSLRSIQSNSLTRNRTALHYRFAIAICTQLTAAVLIVIPNTPLFRKGNTPMYSTLDPALSHHKLV